MPYSISEVFSQFINDEFAYALIDLNGQFLNVNQNFEILTGYNNSELMGNKINILKSGHQEEIFYQNLWATVLNGERWEGEFVNLNKNQNIFYCKTIIYPVKNKEQKISHFVAFYENLTYQKKINERFLNLLQSSNAICWEVNQDGLYTYMSPNVFDLLGHEDQDIIKKKYFYDLFPNDVREQLKSDVDTIMNSKSLTIDFENQLLKKDGNKVWVSSYAYPIIIADKLYGYFGIDINIEKRKELELEFQREREKRIHNEKMASIGTLAAGMAHEIKNPLTITQGGLNLLKKHYKRTQASDEKVEDYFEKCFSSIKRITNIINETLMYSRKENHLTSNVLIDMHNICKKVSHTIIYSPNTKDILLNLNLKAEKSLIRANASVFEQILINLINNAIDSIVEKKNSQDFEGIINISTTNNNNIFELTIKDNGMGIQENIQMNIFDAFFTTKDPGKGTGLGLYLTYKMIEQMGGEIVLESSSNEGSRFKLSFNYG